MPTAADYKSNDQGNQTKYRITIDDIGLNLFNAGDGSIVPIRGKFGPFEATQEQSRREEPIIYDDYSNGMGQAYRAYPHTNAFTINGYTRTPRVFMPSGKLVEVPLDGLGWNAATLDNEITTAMEYNGDLLIGAGEWIIKIIGGSVGPAPVYHLGAGVQIDTLMLYNGVPLCSSRADGLYTQYLSGFSKAQGIWKTASLQGASNVGRPPTAAPYGPFYQDYLYPVYLEKMVKAFQEIGAIGGTRLFGNNGPSTYMYTQSNSVEQLIGDSNIYSATIPVGDSSYRVTNMVASNRVVYIMKTDGVYSIESAGVYHPNVTPYWANHLSEYNGISGAYHAGYLYAGTDRGIDRVNVSSRQRIDVPEMVQPSFYFANETPMFGLPTAMTTDNGWLAIAFYNGKDSHLLYTIPRDATMSNLPAPQIWHGSECTIENEEITMLFTTSISGVPLMWIGTHDGTRMRLYYLYLPEDGNPLQTYLRDGFHQFETGTRSTRVGAPIRPVQLYLPIEDWEDGNAKKILRRFDMQVDFLTYKNWATPPVIKAAGEIDVYAASDIGSRLFFRGFDPSSPLTGWQYQGTASASPRSSFIPNTNITEGHQIAVMLSARLLNIADEGQPANYHPFALRTLKVRASLVIEQMEEREYTVELGHLSANLHGGRNVEDHHVKFSRLYELQNTGPVEMVDEWGEQLLVKVEPGLSYQLLPERVGQPWTIVATITVSVLGRPFYYDTGSTFDSVYAWAN